MIERDDKQIWRRHVDQLKALGDGVAMEANVEDSDVIYPPSISVAVEENTGTAETVSTEAIQTETDPSDTSQLPAGESRAPRSRYPTRTRNPPDRLA